jgi:hypothetical protein
MITGILFTQFKEKKQKYSNMSELDFKGPTKIKISGEMKEYASPDILNVVLVLGCQEIYIPENRITISRSDHKIFMYHSYNYIQESDPERISERCHAYHSYNYLRDSDQERVSGRWYATFDDIPLNNTTFTHVVPNFEDDDEGMYGTKSAAFMIVFSPSAVKKIQTLVQQAKSSI